MTLWRKILKLMSFHNQLRCYQIPDFCPMTLKHGHKDGIIKFLNEGNWALLCRIYKRFTVLTTAKSAAQLLMLLKGGIGLI